MLFPFSLSAHQRACAWKEQERQGKINSLPAIYSSPLSSHEEKIHVLSITQLVSQCKSGTLTPSEILVAYGKITLQAHKATNCLSDIMFNEALNIPQTPNWRFAGAYSRKRGATPDRPLLGVPVSIKDTIDMAGQDTTVSYSCNVGRPVSTSSSIVRLLQDAGALIHAKTTVPTALLSIETVSDIFGLTTNPYNSSFTCGGSTGGGAALLACGGSKVEIGTDLAGSVRVPAHFCGIWSLKGSAGRFPVWGSTSCMMGLEALPIICSPMAGCLDDLKEFWKRVVDMRPWVYDHSCIPLPWRPVDLQNLDRKLKWGVVWDDGTITPSPACKRALTWVIEALREQGHEVVDFSPPSIADGLKIGYELAFADGGAQIKSSLLPTESVNPSLAAVFSLLSLPRLYKKVLAYFYRPYDPVYASLLEIMHPKSVAEEHKLVARRDEYRAAWHERWAEEGLDFVLSVPYPLPALENGTSEKATLMSVGATFISSLLDYTAGVLPITLVDKSIDSYPKDFTSTAQYKNMNVVAKGVHGVYNAEKMHGLPVGVQVIGRRLEEEKVLEGMKVIEEAMKKQERQFLGSPKLKPSAP